jgi:decaprenyl-phosphate phosphoribosyltransferase
VHLIKNRAEKLMEAKKTLTTDGGAPVTDNRNSCIAGLDGSILLEDHHLIEELAHFDRERILERVVHAKGSGAYGYFEPDSFGGPQQIGESLWTPIELPWRALFELLRTRQWVKNGFVFAPLFFGAGLLRMGAVLHALTTFVAFCLISSATYIFNDWCDIEADRAHANKNIRPLASGRVSVPVALSTMAVLVAGAVGVTLTADQSQMVLMILSAYVVISLSYSLGLKQVTVLELLLVSSGFVLRLLAGGFAVNIELSPWIIIATGTIALVLTVGKRRGDIARENDVLIKRKSLAGYNLGYLDALLAALTGTTLVVYLLFSVSDYATARYGRGILVTAIPVAIGLMRYLQVVMVYGDGDAPTDLLLKDKGLITVVLVFIAMFGALVYIR